MRLARNNQRESRPLVDLRMSDFVRWPQKQDSANQLNPDFILDRYLRSEMYGYAGRDTCIVLRTVEETCADVISLKAPRHKADQLVVESAAHCGRKGRVRSEAVRSGMRSPDHDFRERPEFPD